MDLPLAMSSHNKSTFDTVTALRSSKNPGGTPQTTAPPQVPLVDLPARPQKKHPVPPPPLDGKGSFFRTLTKRRMVTGELLSESDDEPLTPSPLTGEAQTRSYSQPWLRRQHDETIDDFTDLTPVEKEFIKRWDDFLLSQGAVQGDKFLPALMMRFSRKNQDWLRYTEGMVLEYFKMGSKLVAYSMIKEETLWQALDLLRATPGPAARPEPSHAMPSHEIRAVPLGNAPRGPPM